MNKREMKGYLKTFIGLTTFFAIAAVVLSFEVLELRDTVDAFKSMECML